jgi:ribosome-associated heat shock protein Hsp15
MECSATGVDTVRLDVWLWAARFYRTRALAAAAAGGGQVQLNEQRVKPAHPVRVGDAVTVRRDALVWQAIVTGIAAQRGSAAVAATLYREPEAAREAREAAIAQRRANAPSPRFPGRPSKRDRRRLEDFLGEP